MGRSYDRDTYSSEEETPRRDHYRRPGLPVNNSLRDRLSRSTTPMSPTYQHEPRRVSGLASASGESASEKPSREGSQPGMSKKRAWEQVDKGGPSRALAMSKKFEEVPLVLTNEQVLENYRRHQDKLAKQKAVMENQQAVMAKLINKTGYETPSDEEMAVTEEVSTKKTNSTGISCDSYKKRAFSAKTRFNAAFIPTSLKGYGDEIPMKNPVFDQNSTTFDAHGYKLSISVGHQNLMNIRAQSVRVPRDVLFTATKHAAQVMVDAYAIYLDKFVTDEELNERYSGFTKIDATNSHIRLLAKRNQKDYFMTWFDGVIGNPRLGISAGHVAQMVTNLMVWSRADVPTTIININRSLKGLTGKHYRKCEKLIKYD